MIFSFCVQLATPLNAYGWLYGNLIFRLCNFGQVQIVILNSVESLVEEEICADLQEILKVLQVSLCGLQNPQNLELMQYLKTVIN
jgi:predicted site-specific integrase-resolvase